MDMLDTMQDDELLRSDMQRHERLVCERAPYENVWRDIEERLGDNSGAFGGNMTPGRVRGQANFDVTHVEGRERMAAVMTDICTPESQQYIRARFGDPDLQKLPSVQRWCERASDRLYAIRYAPHAGFGVSVNEDWRQSIALGTSPVWNGVYPDGRGLFYSTLHLSSCFIDTDFSGMVNIVHRRMCEPVSFYRDMFGPNGLTPKMQKAWAEKKYTQEFEVIHMVCPNYDIKSDRMGWQAMPIASRYLAVDEKIYLKVSGFHTMPISVSRHSTNAFEKYGRGVMIRVLPTIDGLNTMRRTALRSMHKQADPALAFFDDDGITSLVTKPGGLNPGLVDENGRLMVQAIPGGGDLSVAMLGISEERQVVDDAFLGMMFKMLRDDKVQRSAQAVLEIASEKGIVVGPFARRYASEKQNPLTQRDLDLAMRAGQIEPFPPEVLEAGTHPIIEYENPLAVMARAEQNAGFTRWIEALAPLAQTDGGQVFDYINTDVAVPGLAEGFGVRASYVATPDELAAKRQAREDAKQEAAGVDQLATAAGAYADLAKGNQLIGERV